MKTTLKTLFPLLALSVPAADAATTLNPANRARVSFNGNKSTTSDFLTATTTSSGMVVGDASNDDTVHSAIFNFNVSTVTSQIADATQILFYVTPTSIVGDTVPDIRLVALTNDSNSTTGARSTAAGTIVATLPLASITANTTLAFDVTSYVKADALAGTYSSFRMESILEASNGGGTDYVLLGTIGTNDARLEIIPEPSSGFLASTAAMMILAMRRRRN